MLLQKYISNTMRILHFDRRNGYRRNSFFFFFWVYSMTLNSCDLIMKPNQAKYYSFPFLFAYSIRLHCFLSNPYLFMLTRLRRSNDSHASNTHSVDCFFLFLLFLFLLLCFTVLFYRLFSFRFTLVSTFVIRFSRNFSILAFFRFLITHILIFLHH